MEKERPENKPSKPSTLRMSTKINNGAERQQAKVGQKKNVIAGSKTTRVMKKQT